MSSPFASMLSIVLLLVSYAAAQQSSPFVGFNVSIPSAQIAPSDSTTITWTQLPTNKTLAILLKQGDNTGASAVVDVIAKSNVQNNGTYTWNVSNTTAAGANYYIRVQTGTSGDWQGGLGTEKTPGQVTGTNDVYSLSPYFEVGEGGGVWSASYSSSPTSHSTGSINIPQMTTSFTSSPSYTSFDTSSGTTPPNSSPTSNGSSSSNKGPAETAADVTSRSVVLLGLFVAYILL